MDQSVVLWLIAQGIGIGMAGIGALTMMHRNLVEKIETGDNALHHRINDTREKYVRRDDLDAHLNIMREQLGRMDAKLDRIMERQPPKPH
jgi:hypothetical protein